MAETAAQEAPAPPGNLVALMTAVRWGTTTLGLIWSTILTPDAGTIGFGVVLLAYALWRTLRPLRYRSRGWRSLVSILVELAISLAAIVSTGCWDSPYIFVLFTPVIAAGFERGIWHSSRVAATGVITVTAAAWALDNHQTFSQFTSWTGELLLVACVASYGRHLIDNAERAAAVNLSQLRRLNQANALLVGLNRLAHDMPVSFDLNSTVEASVEDVHATVDADLTALLLLDRVSDTWTVAHARGARVKEVALHSDLPPSVRDVSRTIDVHLVTNLSPDNPGLSNGATAGIYAPLWSGATQVGLLVVEAVDGSNLNAYQVEIVEELAGQIAITVDNARWFEKLQARGATQERNRIARDLHDRVGQGVAYIAFELDRLCSQAGPGEIGDELSRLRDDTRKIVGELREALYDLRTDVSQQQSLTDTINEFLGRVSRRSDVEVTFDHEENRRLSVVEEREVWRIAQESIVNAERHANAKHITVTWHLDDRTGILTIQDDGNGMAPPTGSDRPSYGITGMRERAGVIGARLDITPAEPQGTVVTLTIGAADASSSDFVTKTISEEAHGARA